MSTPYNDMYNNYWGNSDCCPNNSLTFEYGYPFSFEERNKLYLQMKQKPLIAWNCGDTVEINYNINFLLTDENGSVVSPEDVDFSDYELVFTFANFRHECMFRIKKEVESLVKVELDAELSRKYFPRGIYYNSVVLKQKEPEEETEEKVVGTFKILLTQDDGLIYVN